MKTDEATVLIVEDEKDVREPLAEYLCSEGLSVTTTPDGSIAVEKLDATSFDLVLTDIQMPEMNGMELLRHVRIKYPSIPVIMFTAFGTIEDAVDTIRLGAYDYVLKPLVFEDILQKIRGAIEFKHSELRDDPSGVSDDRPLGLDAIIGSSPPIQRLKEQIQKVADGDVSVVIQGPSGTGKELVASALHYLSRRRKQPFVAVNCAAIPESLLESSFFWSH